ncbi:MAG: universal stress protein [Bacteroidota bacterium]
MKTKKKILVAIDFDEQSLIALKYAKYYAEISKYDLEVMAVIEESGFMSKLVSSDEMIVKINNEAQNKLKEIVGSVPGGIKVNTRVENGKPYEKIIDVAEKIKPAFIFMGKSELPKYKRPFVGSNSMHVILDSIYPVITIRGNFDFNTYKNEHHEILVPLDFKYETSEQVTAAIEFAKMFNTDMRILAIQTHGGKGDEMKLLTNLGTTKKVIEEAGINCDSELIQEEKLSIPQIISESAIKNKSALVVIMTRQESRVSEYVLGSNARDLISGMDIPVLSIQPWDVNKGSKIFSMFYDPLDVY